MFKEFLNHYDWENVISSSYVILFHLHALPTYFSNMIISHVDSKELLSFFSVIILCSVVLLHIIWIN